MPVEPISLGVAIGFEILKFAMDERNLRLKMAAAGMSQAAIDAHLTDARSRIASMESPTKLPEV
jgi:hypothetical protein